MTTTFKHYLLLEGGAATAKYDVQRATKQDIEKALDLVSVALSMSRDELKASLLGSTTLTLAGAKTDSGDVDIAMSSNEMDPEEANKRMMKLTNNEGVFNKGTNVGSYAVNVGNKKIQVDLMYVNDKEWAKFIYHSAQGKGSKYPGPVRNLLLMAVVRHKQEAGKDLIVKDGDRLIARASRALKLDTGVERLFKMAKKNKRTGAWSNNVDKIDPSALQQNIEALTGKKVQFSHDADVISNPDKVASFIFGEGTKAADIMTAEQVVKKIKQLPNAEEIIKYAKEDLQSNDLPIPTEL